METSPSEIDHFITVFQNASSLEEKLQLFCERDDVQSFIQENLGIEEMFKWNIGVFIFTIFVYSIFERVNTSHSFTLFCVNCVVDAYKLCDFQIHFMC